jgi:hypothetical protein
VDTKHFLALAALAACLSAPPAFAYPNAEQKHVVSAGGASWTVLQDHKNPLRWYYVPAQAKLVESGKPGKLQPELALLKYQAPSPTDKTRLVENAFLLVTLRLTPEKAMLDQLANAIGNLKPMQEAKAAAKDILLEEIALQDIKLKLPESRAEAAPDEGFGLPVPATALQFTLHLPDISHDTTQKLLSQGLKAQLEFNYVAGTPKPDGQKPVLASFGAQTTGSVGFGAYPREVQEKSIIIIPPGGSNIAFFRLPPASETAGITQLTYQVSLRATDGKQVPGIPAELAAWKAPSGWMDRKGNRIDFLLFPLNLLADVAGKAGKRLTDYAFQIDGVITVANRTEKFSGTAALFTHDAPIAIPPPLAKSLRLSPEFLDPATVDAACEDLAAAQLKLACGRTTYLPRFKFGKNETSSNAPMTFFFDKACGSVKLEGSLICRDGKRHALSMGNLGNTPGATMYLGY